MYLILSILIATGDRKQFPKPKFEIRFGWGMSYNYIGKLHYDLNKYDVVVGLEIPELGQFHNTHHSPLIYIILRSGMIHSM